MRARFMETNMTLLKFSDVSLAFGAMPLLDKVSWQIARGERVCIIGATVPASPACCAW